MKTRRSATARLTAVLLCAVCFLYVAASPMNYISAVSASSSSDSKVKGYEERIAQLKEKQKLYEKQISEAREAAAGYLEQKTLLDGQMSVLREEIELSNALLAEYTASISAKEEEIVFKEAELEERLEKHKERLRVSYEDGVMGYLTMLFSSKNFSDFLTSVERVMNMLNYDKRVMKQMNDERAALTEEKNKLDEMRAAQTAVTEGLKASEAELEAKALEAEKLYNETVANEEKLILMLEESKAAQEKAEKELDEYLEELAKKNSGVYDGGAFSWPLPQNQNRITSKHGRRTYWIRGRKVTDWHRGIDIGCPSGTPVYAAADGTVEIAGWNDSYGNYVVISHGSGYTTLYAHNSYLNVKAGQKVTRGQQIAVSGATGNISGAHLHLEISINGKLQDPLANGILSHPTLVYLCD